MALKRIAESVHLDARPAAALHWGGEPDSAHPSQSSSRKPEMLATVRLAASASAPPGPTSPSGSRAGAMLARHGSDTSIDRLQPRHGGAVRLEEASTLSLSSTLVDVEVTSGAGGHRGKNLSALAVCCPSPRPGTPPASIVAPAADAKEMSRSHLDASVAPLETSRSHLDASVAPQETSRSHLDALAWRPAQPSQHPKAARSASTSTTRGELSALSDLRSDFEAHIRESHQKLLRTISALQEEQQQKAELLETALADCQRSQAAQEQQQEVREASLQDALQTLQQRQHLSIENLRADPDGLRLFFAELVEPLQIEVASTCANHEQWQQEMQAQATQLALEQQGHTASTQAALSELHGLHSQISAGAKSKEPGQESWRRELEVLRGEQQAALADQVRLLQHQFEAAYRAEQLADAAVGRVGALERSLAEAHEEHQFQALEHRLKSLEVAGGSEAKALSPELHFQLEGLEVRLRRMEVDQLACSQNGEAAIDMRRAQPEAQRISQLQCHIDDLSSALACQAERLCRVEEEFPSYSAEQNGKLAEALSQQQHLTLGSFSENVQKEQAALRVNIAELQAEFQHGLRQMQAEQQREERRGKESIARVEQVAAHHDELASTAALARAEHEQCKKKLGKLEEDTAGQLASVHQQTTEWQTDLLRRLGCETDARVSADLQLRAELTNAMVVIKSQFAEWMDMVTGLKSEFAALSQAARAEKDTRAREAMDKRTELSAVIEFAHSNFSEAQLCTNAGAAFDARAPPVDVSQLPGSGGSDMSLVCRFINDTLGHGSRLWAKCHKESCTAAEKAERIQHELRDACREWKQELGDLHKQLPRLLEGSSHGSESQLASVKRDVGLVLNMLGARKDGRVTEVCDILARLQCLERRLDLTLGGRPSSPEKNGGQKLEARRAILHAMDNMEAAAQRVALETSTQPWSACDGSTG